MAVGAPDAFLPELVSKIEGADTEAERILFLHALKEVSCRCLGPEGELIIRLFFIRLPLSSKLWRIIPGPPFSLRTLNRQTPISARTVFEMSKRLVLVNSPLPLLTSSYPSSKTF